LFFHISCVYLLGFMHLQSSFWLDILISCVLSAEVFTMDSSWVVMYFLTTGLGVWFSSQKVTLHSQDTGSSLLLHSGRRRLATEAITVDRHIHYKNTVILN
jgi:hypothetical protein